MRQGLYSVVVTGILLALPPFCSGGEGDDCQLEPEPPVAAFLDGDTPAHPESFSGTIDSVDSDGPDHTIRVVVRAERGEVRTLVVAQLGEPVSFPVGRQVRVRLEYRPGFPSLSGLLLTDAAGLALAAVGDHAPGRTVLRDGIPGFRIRSLPASCPSRPHGTCYDSVVNLPLLVEHGGEAVELMHGQSARLGEYQVFCLVSQTVAYNSRCADAGVVALVELPEAAGAVAPLANSAWNAMAWWSDISGGRLDLGNTGRTQCGGEW
jgi:hypothetical protein